MSAAEIPSPFPDKNPRATPKNEKDFVLGQKDLDASRELFDRLEIDPESLSGLLSDISNNRQELIAYIVDLSEIDLSDTAVTREASAKASELLNKFLSGIGDLPAKLRQAETHDPQAINEIIEQYKLIDTALVTRLNDVTGQDNLFIACNYGIAEERLEEIYNENDDIEHIKNYVKQFFGESIHEDVATYQTWIANRDQHNYVESSEHTQNLILENTEAIVDYLEFQAKSPAQRLGKHALDVAKIAAGSALGLMIAKRFSR